MVGGRLELLGYQKGRLVLNMSAQRGFTLIEVLVGITLMVVLLGLGVPPLATFLQNNRISSAASSYLAGLQSARAEAIRLNVPVEFVLTNATGVGAAPAVAGRNWIVRAVPPAPAAPTLIDQKIGNEGEGGTTQSVAVAITAPASFDGRITFNGFGAPTDNPYVINLTNPTMGLCAPTGPARCRRINVNAGGQVTLCDPAVTAAGDNRAC